MEINLRSVGTQETQEAIADTDAEATHVARERHSMSGSTSGSFSLPATLTVWTAEDAMFQLARRPSPTAARRCCSSGTKRCRRWSRRSTTAARTRRRRRSCGSRGLGLSVGLDEWVFFLLSSKDGLLVFLDQAAKRRHDPEAKFSLYQIRRATRGTAWSSSRTACRCT